MGNYSVFLQRAFKRQLQERKSQFSHAALEKLRWILNLFQYNVFSISLGKLWLKLIFIIYIK